MKKTKLALAIAASTMITSPAFATNGDNLIGLGAQARALGGTGTAAFFGAENALTNPALLAKSQGTEFSIGGTIFKPDVTATTDVATSLAGAPAASQTSDNDLNIIPEVAMSTRLNENLTFGLGMFGSAGMGVDYRDTDALFNGYSNLQLMKFVPTIAYNESNFGLGFSPVVQYGALDINYKTDSDGDFATDTVHGNGMSTDIGYGFNIGAYIDVTPEFTLALAYQSAIEMEYDGQLTTAADGFGIGPNGMQTISSDKLEQPAEIKMGAAYTTGNWMFTADAKQIKWSDSKGYETFNWDDQNVFGLGAKYAGKDFWVGAGYNYGSDPIDQLSGATNQNQAFSDSAVNLFNNHFFPAVVEKHFTFGGGVNLMKNMALDMAIVYAPEIDKTVDTSAISSAFASQAAGTPTAVASSHTVEHSQIGYTLSLRMNF